MTRSLHTSQKRPSYATGLIPSPVKPKTQTLVFLAYIFDAQHYKNDAVDDGDEKFFNLKPVMESSTQLPRTSTAKNFEYEYK